MNCRNIQSFAIVQPVVDYRQLCLSRNSLSSRLAVL